jgi:hypothetical protein
LFHCPASTNALVETFDHTGVATPLGFFVAFFG